MNTVCTKHRHERPELETATIFNRYWNNYIKMYKVTKDHRKAAWAIMNCRTRNIGIHKEKCSDIECDYEAIAYDSCFNRNCAKCEGSKRLKWVAKRLLELLPIHYFHVVFTMPHMLCLLALFNQAIIYDFFFKATSYTLKAFSKDPRFLGSDLGFIGILHTWGERLFLHPHIHYIVTGGGLTSEKSTWKRLPYRKKFLFPSYAMSRTLRREFILSLKSAYKQGKLVFPGKLSEISSPSEFDLFCSKLGRQSWYNYSKPPFSGPQKVLEYLSRYIHRVAISNRHLVKIENDQIYFTYKDYKDNEKIKLTSLPAFVFIRRFLMHVLPSGFRKIRYYGFLNTAAKNKNLEIVRELLDNFVQESMDSIRNCIDRIENYLIHKCPKCKVGTLIYVFDTS